jgi:predicted nucleic acid-binding protein
VKYLLDTNILSELKKPKPEQKVINFINSIDLQNFYISSITIGEIQKGINSCPNINKQEKLNEWLENFILEEYSDQILNLDVEVMRVWGRLISNSGKNIAIIDSLIAAVCITHNLILVTRNVKDFIGIKSLKIINPWDV